MLTTRQTDALLDMGKQVLELSMVLNSQDRFTPLTIERLVEDCVREIGTDIKMILVDAFPRMYEGFEFRLAVKWNEPHEIGDGNE